VKLRILVSALAIAGLLACDQPAVDAAASAPKPAAPAGEVVLAAAKPKPPAPKSRKEKPLPAFSGRTLTGEKLAVSSLIGKRLLIFFFNPEVKQAPLVTEAVTNVAKLRGEHNFAIIGVAAGSDTRTTQQFVEGQGIDFPVIDDTQAAISRRLGLRVPIAMLGVDAEGFVSFGLGQFPTEGPDTTKS